MSELLAQGLVFLAGVCVWWQMRKVTRTRQRWRRRVGTIFFLLPFLLAVGRALPLPDATKVVIDGLGKVDHAIDALLATLTGFAKENLTGFWLAAAKMAINAGVYGALGVLVGWPLDRWLGPTPEEAKKADAAAAKK